MKSDKDKNSKSTNNSWFYIIDISGILFIMLISVLVIIASIFMERPRGWASAPGLLPVIVGGTLFIMCFFLLISTLKEKKEFGSSGSKLRRYLCDVYQGNKKALQIIGLVAIYYFLLIKFLPFELATAIYIFVSLFQFWEEGSLAKKIIISIVIPVLLTYIMREAFYLHMPGNTILDYILYR